MAKKRKHMVLKLISFILISVSVFIIFFTIKENPQLVSPLPLEAGQQRYWEVQAIDTMKFSRDTAREKRTDPSFDKVIDDQVREIAETGATHVAIATPYEEEFLPYLKRWVAAARKYELKVWFRGNLAGWEGWFEYEKIDRETHKKQIEAFILNNPDLFENGDIFVSCPECENGGPGDPRMKGDAVEYRKFLIDEYQIVKNAFNTINKDVASNYFSMNGDVARLIMDRETTTALDGVVTIDHYVGTPEKLSNDIKDYIKNSGGKVILGEWGAPIPDIHGEMTEEEQAAWLDDAMKLFITEPNLIGHNYWVNRGGSTELWSDDTVAKKGVSVLKKYFKPTTFTITTVTNSGKKVSDVTAKTPYRSFSSSDSMLNVPVLGEETVVISKEGYRNMVIQLKPGSTDRELVLTMEKEHETIWDKLLDLF